MKILQIGKFYFPNSGGIETLSQNLSEGLVKRGHDITFICFSKSGEFISEVINGVKVLRFPHLGIYFSQPISLKIILYILKNRANFDLIHYHTPNPWLEFFIWLFPRKTKIVCSYHSDVVRQKILMPFYFPVLQMFLKRLDRIIVATEGHIKFSKFIKEFDSKCTIIPYGLDHKKHEVNQDILDRAKLLKETLSPYIFFIGRHVQYKGVEYLIKSMKNINCNCIIAGDGPLRNQLENLAKDLNLLSKIKFIGPVQDDNLLNALYLGCEIFVLPSISPAEAFGIVMIEAMAMGAPVVSTLIESGVQYVNINGDTGLVAKIKDETDLADKINEILQNHSLRKRLSENCVSRFKNMYTDIKMVESYLRCYDLLFSK